MIDLVDRVDTAFTGHSRSSGGRARRGARRFSLTLKVSREKQSIPFTYTSKWRVVRVPRHSEKKGEKEYQRSHIHKGELFPGALLARFSVRKAVVLSADVHLLSYKEVVA